MLNPEQLKLHKKAQKILWIIWGSMTLSIFIYVAVAYMVRQQGIAVEITAQQLELMKLIGWFMAPVMFVVALWIKKFMLGRYKRRLHQGHPQQQINQDQDLKQDQHTTTQQPIYINRVQTATVFSLALGEIPVIYGFVLFLLGESFDLLIIYVAVSVLANVVNRPKDSDLERLALMDQGASNIYTVYPHGS